MALQTYRDYTMRTNLPKTLDQLIFSKFKFTKSFVNVPKFTKFTKSAKY